MKVCAAAGNERKSPIISAQAAISGRRRHGFDRKMLKCCSCGENTKAGGKKHEHRCNAVGKTKENGASFCGTESIGSTKQCPNVSVPTVLGQNVSEADAEKHGERSKPKPEPKQEHTAQQPDTKEVHQKSAQQLEAERQQKLENLRAAMQNRFARFMQMWNFRQGN